MHKPMTMLIRATQSFPFRLPSKANGNTIVATVTRPTIQPKTHAAAAWSRKEGARGQLRPGPARPP